MDEIPGVEPTELVPEMPREWIEGTGKVRWTSPKEVRTRRLKCEDCLNLIKQWLAEYPEITRSPGLARYARYKRRQGGIVTLHCEHHFGLRTGKESLDG